MPSVKLVVTDAGIAEVINAEATGTAPVKLTEIGLGTGKYTASGSQEALVSEFKRLDTVAGGSVGTNIIHVSVTDDSEDSYSVYEIGLYTESGTLFAVYSQSLPIIQKASAALMMLSLDIALTNISNASVTFGNTDFTMAPATVTNQGIAELATHEEVQDGKDDTRIVTPAGLASRTATEERAGLVELATSAEVKAGTDSSRAVTPAGLKSAMDGRTASDSQTGLVELATDAEVQAGTDAGKAVTPKGLASRTATEARTGLVELATTAEVQAGTDISKAVTPKGLASRTATESRTGLAEIATQTEVDAGTDDSRIVTSKKLLAALEKLGLQGLETWRKSMIGCLVPMAMATLPAGFGKPDGSLFLFEDYPELKEKYDDGGFEGMLLEATASDEDKAAWVGKWVKHAEGIGLYAPRLQGLFLRNAGGAEGTMGAYLTAGLPNGTGSTTAVRYGAVYENYTSSGAFQGIDTTSVFEVNTTARAVQARYDTFDLSLCSPVYGASDTVMPASVNTLIALYLGRHA